MPDPRTVAVKVAETASTAWWKTHGTGREEIALGVVAALALTRQADPAGPDPAALILGARRDEISDLLQTIWKHFAIVRPELSIRTGPLAAWLDDPTESQLDGAAATARAAVKAGQLGLTGDRDLACEVDLLGHVNQELRATKAKRATGLYYTPAAVADILARMTLSDAQPGQVICDPCAGTGGLLRAAAHQLRLNGIDPHAMVWQANDIDATTVAALAVNVHLWDLGRCVTIGYADTLAEPDWPARAVAEQNHAIEVHNIRVLIARFLALEQAVSRTSPDEASRTA